MMVVLLANVRPATCDGWSLPNPFSSTTKSETKTKTHITTVKTQEPSMLEKIGTGTKNFFDRTGEKLGLKKPASKKYDYATAQKPHVHASKPSSKSWLSKMFAPRNPKKPKTVTDWMGQPRRDL